MTGNYTFGEEIANSITHGIGVLLSIVGLVLLIITAMTYGTTWHIVSFAIFGSTLIALYLASTLYHSIPIASWKQILRKIDHAAIFILIAGTYTPFMLVNLRGVWGWSLFGVIWGLAAAGIALKIACISRFQKLSLAIYILMGWLAVIAAQEMFRTIAPTSLILLFMGGLSYTIGVIFYVWKKLPYNHAIWHLFVLGGSIFHYFAVLQNV